jgi:hypothetical protein
MMKKMAHQIAFAILHFLAKRAKTGEIPFVLKLLSLRLRPSIRQQHAQKTRTLSNVLAMNVSLITRFIHALFFAGKIVSI